MINKVFKDLLGNTMEAYVDDMIIKRRKTKSHATNLAPVFEVLQKYNMRLNPNKCSFDVQSKFFRGYMITQHGIEANSKKIQTILDMQSPTSIKEVQQLTRRVATLNIFLSKSIKKVFAFSRH